MTRIEPRAIGSCVRAWKFITALIGELLDIEAFFQPGVELGKKIAHRLPDREGFEKWAELGVDEAAAAPVLAAD